MDKILEVYKMAWTILPKIPERQMSVFDTDVRQQSAESNSIETIEILS